MVELASYISVDDIQQQIIHMSKKQIRRFIHRYLPVKKIGKRIFVSREELENLLSNPDRCRFPLDGAE